MGRRRVILTAFFVLLAIIAVAIWSSATSTTRTGTDGALYGESVDLGIPEGATAATIEYVHDGDTLFLADGRKVRLLGVDTPEVGDHAECFGQEATALLRSMLPEGAGVLLFADVQPLDEFGRSLLLIWLEDGTFVNLELIGQGAAEAVVLEPNLLYAAEFEAAEDAAQAASLGLWGACG